MTILRTSLGLLAALVLSGSAWAETCRVTRVVDGDTVRLDCGQGARRARLLGYDTPELFHPRCPAEKRAALDALARLRALVARGPVTAVRVEGRDRYGRDLVALSIAGQDVAAFMLQGPLALPYAGHAHPDWCARL